MSSLLFSENSWQAVSQQVQQRVNDMKVSDIRSVCAELFFPQEAQDTFASAFEVLCSSEEALHLMELNSALFWREFFPALGAELKNLDLISSLTGIHKYTVYELFYLMNYRQAEKEYRLHGISDQIFHDSMMELNYKMLITHNIYGVWGSAYADWFSGFYRRRTFCIGRLEYELVECFSDYTNGSYHIEKGAPIINVHIPETGPLKPDLVIDSFRKAAEFFKDCFSEDVIPFECLSWILYPPVVELFPKKNLKSFASFFDVIKTEMNQDHDDRWRIFQVAPTVELKDYPEDTTLQRSLKEWLLMGNTMGIGNGIFFFHKGEIIAH